MDKCRICTGSYICFDLIETKVQLLEPECHLSPDHTIMKSAFLCGFTVRTANSSCYLAKGQTHLSMSNTFTLADTCPLNIFYLEEKQVTRTGLVNWCSKLANGTCLQSLTKQKNLCRQPFLWHAVKSYEFH